MTHWLADKKHKVFEDQRHQNFWTIAKWKQAMAENNFRPLQDLRSADQLWQYEIMSQLGYSSTTALELHDDLQLKRGVRG